MLDSRKGTALGYGARPEVVSRDKLSSPGPMRYNIPSTRTNIAKSFGESRDKFNKVFIPGVDTPDRDVPGPGTYLPLDFDKKRILQKSNVGFPIYKASP